MDSLSHGLWGAIAFGRQRGLFGSYRWRSFFFALLLGMGPDLCTFGPRFLGWALNGFADYPIEPGTEGAPALSSLPNYVFTAYNLTHSLIIWSLIFFLLWLLLRRPVWIFCAWALHILFDIPTHTTAYFPTPFLWPFPTPYVEGVHWHQNWFLLTNYALIAVILGVILLWKARER